MRRMKRVFVCSAFRGDVARSVEVARAACEQVVREGDAPFAPHLLYPTFLDDSRSDDRESGIRAGLAWLPAADEILVIGEPTEGMREEISAAEMLGLPIRRIATVALVLLALLFVPACVSSRDAASVAKESPT